MTLHDSVFENVIGDLEYNPRRAVIYLVVASVSAAVWILAPSEARLSLAPLVFGAGSLTLLLKGVFLLRKSSDGLSVSRTLDFSHQRFEGFVIHEAPKGLPPLPVTLAQLVQDFGAGGLRLGPVLHFLENVDHSRMNLPVLGVIASGASAFVLGWLIRYLFGLTKGTQY